MKRNLPFILTIFLFLIPQLLGQSFEREKIAVDFSDLSEAPQERLLDLGDVFAESEATKSELSQRLLSLEERFGFSVYFVAYSGIIGSNVQEKAIQFRDAWLGSEQEGLVFVCDTDMKQMAHSVTKVDNLPIDGSSHAWKLPDHELVAALTQVSLISSKDLTEQEYLILLGNTLASELEERLGVKEESPRSFIFGFLLIFSISAGLILLSMWWAQKRAQEDSEGSTASFPTMDIPTRLGAAYGGGAVNEISFQVPKQVDSP